MRKTLFSRIWEAISVSVRGLWQRPGALTKSQSESGHLDAPHTISIIYGLDPSNLPPHTIDEDSLWHPRWSQRSLEVAYSQMLKPVAHQPQAQDREDEGRSQ